MELYASTGKGRAHRAHLGGETVKVVRPEDRRAQELSLAPPAAMEAQVLRLCRQTEYGAERLLDWPHEIRAAILNVASEHA